MFLAIRARHPHLIPVVRLFYGEATPIRLVRSEGMLRAPLLDTDDMDVLDASPSDAVSKGDFGCLVVVDPSAFTLSCMGRGLGLCRGSCLPSGFLGDGARVREQLFGATTGPQS